MKILYFHQHFSTPQGSTGTRSYHFAKKLVEAGHEVYVICGSYNVAVTGLNGKFAKGLRKGTVEGINVTEIDVKYSNRDTFIKRTFLFIKYALYSIKISLSEDYDLLFATSTPLTASLPGIIAKIFRNKPFIFEVRDLWPELPKAMKIIKNPFILGAMDILETIAYKSASACIGLAPGIIDGIRKKEPNKKVVFIPNGSDVSLNINKKETKREKFIAAFTGAHGYANGLHIILDTAKVLMKKKCYDIEFHFIGDGALKSHLKIRAKEENLSNCHFLNPMDKGKLFDYIIKNVDVGLMILDNIPAFYYGTSPNKFFDYISLGLPVINNYPGWIADHITKSQCGKVVRPDDSIAFSQAILDLKNNPQEMKTMSLKSLELAKNEFNRDKLNEDFLKFIESCIKY